MRYFETFKKSEIIWISITVVLLIGLGIVLYVNEQRPPFTITKEVCEDEQVGNESFDYGRYSWFSYQKTQLSDDFLRANCELFEKYIPNYDKRFEDSLSLNVCFEIIKEQNNLEKEYNDFRGQEFLIGEVCNDVEFETIEYSTYLSCSPEYKDRSDLTGFNHVCFGNLTCYCIEKSKEISKQDLTTEWLDENAECVEGSYYWNGDEKIYSDKGAFKEECIWKLNNYTIEVK